MTVECPVCKGDGLVGAGTEPHLKQGPVTTCGNCGGTGSVEEGVLVEEAPVVEAQTPSSSEVVTPEVVAEAPVEEAVQPEASVDNVETPQVEEGATLETAQEEVLG